MTLGDDSDVYLTELGGWSGNDTLGRKWDDFGLAFLHSKGRFQINVIVLTCFFTCYHLFLQFAILSLYDFKKVLNIISSCSHRCPSCGHIRFMSLITVHHHDHHLVLNCYVGDLK